MGKIDAVLIVVFMTSLCVAEDIASQGDATRFTRTANSKCRLSKVLKWDDKKELEFAERGFIAPLDSTTIRKDSGRLVWSNVPYDKLFSQEACPDTVNPSLWRHEKISSRHGLYKVADDFYQIRGQDLSNISFIDTPKGYIVIDPLASSETAKAAYEMVCRHIGRKPVIAVIYSHSHIDHFAGVKGVVSDADVKAGKVNIIAPKGFAKYAVEENVIAGNAMSRRAFYMYGLVMPVGAKAQVGAGEGKSVSKGTRTLVLPTHEIGEAGERMTIGGEELVFSFAPGEAPTGMHVYSPSRKVLYLADNCVHGIQNVYTIRGARTRNPLVWIESLESALSFKDAEVCCAGHNWPRFGKDEVCDYISNQRDALKYMHDQTVRLLNHGYTGRELEDLVKLPDSLAGKWYLRSYYGSVRHNVRAVYSLYMGWYDGNPTNLHPLPPREGARKMLEYMGGSEAVLARAEKDFAAGNYRWVLQVVDYVLWTEPDNRKARLLAAAAHEQLGYQSECSTWRNAYLFAARELRNGIDKSSSRTTISPDIIAAMTVPMIFELLAVRLNAEKAAGTSMTINWSFPDIKEEYVMELRNSVLDCIRGKAESPDASVSLSRADLNQLISGKAKVAGLAKSGRIRTTDNGVHLQALFAMLDKFEVSFPVSSHEPICEQDE